MAQVLVLLLGLAILLILIIAIISLVKALGHIGKKKVKASKASKADEIQDNQENTSDIFRYANLNNLPLDKLKSMYISCAGIAFGRNREDLRREVSNLSREAIILKLHTLTSLDIEKVYTWYLKQKQVAPDKIADYRNDTSAPDQILQMLNEGYI